MFTTLVVQPIFNVLVTIYALIPGHNFGVAIILFTIVARVALYPLLKKQLRNTKAMRELQPELKKIKKATKGNKQQESMMMMELYKEKEVKPLSQIGLMVLQLIVFLALFSGLNRVVGDPQQIVDFSYSPVQNLSFMKEVSNDISLFDNTLLGKIDLGRPAYAASSGLYIPALIMVVGSAIIAFFQIKQTLPNEKDGKKLRDILKDANKDGAEPDSSEVSAVVGRNMAYFMPGMILFLTIGFPAALALYWFVGGLISFTQQTNLLRSDEYSMDQQATAVVVSKKTLEQQKKTKRVTKAKAGVKKKSSSSKAKNKRR